MTKVIIWSVKVQCLSEIISQTVEREDRGYNG